MGDHKRGTAHHEPVQGFLYDPFTFRIQGGSGFVQDQDPGILQDGPGNGNALALSPGHVDAPVSQVGVIPLGQVLDEFVRIGGLGGGQHFFPGGIQPNPKPGCRFAARCPYATAKCQEPQQLREIESGHFVQCCRIEEID